MTTPHDAYTVCHEQLVPLLLNELQKKDAEDVAQQSQIDAQQDQIDELRAEVEALKQAIDSMRGTSTDTMASEPRWDPPSGVSLPTQTNASN